MSGDADRGIVPRYAVWPARLLPRHPTAELTPPTQYYLHTDQYLFLPDRGAFFEPRGQSGYLCRVPCRSGWLAQFAAGTLRRPCCCGPKQEGEPGVVILSQPAKGGNEGLHAKTDCFAHLTAHIVLIAVAGGWRLAGAWLPRRRFGG